MESEIKIMLVEDNIEDATFTQRVLKFNKLHEDLVLAASGQEALEALEKCNREASLPNLILLDINLPGMSGLEVLAKLGELIPNSPVVIVTASPTSENAIAALRLGAFDFIVKGFKNEVMLATVARAVERRRMTIRDRALISQLEAKIQELLAILAEHTQESEQSSERRLHA